MKLRVLITGADGFIGKNLALRLTEVRDWEVVLLTRADSEQELMSKVAAVDAIVHLAGVNRPNDVSEFHKGNTLLTSRICRAAENAGRRILLILASSIQATQNNAYGESKRQAELAVEEFSRNTGSSAVIYRLPNVFGKWSKPNYNSVVATFAHNIANDLPITVSDSATELTLVYIDDVVEEFLRALASANQGVSWGEVKPQYRLTLGELAAHLLSFKECRNSLILEHVGTGVMRALYSTYVSYLPPARFAYSVPQHVDSRGSFVEMLKTRDSGQFSYFTAHPGVTRGGHYHHTKTEKFMVIKGAALFGFRHLISGERFSLETTGDRPQIVETIPGWTHDITNIGKEEMVVMLWANEIFDRSRPDTVACKV
jgi:UDP-2-acetamido-2,6-beta-L-arabino-hexul-4-ose reductase